MTSALRHPVLSFYTLYIIVTLRCFHFEKEILLDKKWRIEIQFNMSFLKNYDVKEKENWRIRVSIAVPLAC